MSHQQNIAIAQKLLEGIRSGRDPAEIATLFDADVIFEIQGDDGVLPWIGRKTGRQAIAHFIRDIRTLTEPVTFEVEDILASDSRAAIIGALQTRIKATGKIIATQFAIILTITGDVVTRYQMLEDSFDVSKAARICNGIRPNKDDERGNGQAVCSGNQLAGILQQNVRSSL
jgi:ketosteroid isomerase-like protein